MSWGEGRHDQVVGELAKWWQDLWHEHTGSRVVLVTVPPGWGRTTLLHRFRQAAEDPEGPVGLVAWIDGHQSSMAAQVLEIREALAAAVGQRPGLAGLLDMDRATGRIQFGLGLAGLFPSGITAAASLLVVSLAVTAAGNAWDARPVGEQGAAARAAREVARISVQIPAAVIIDDADQLDPGLALTVVRGLAERPGGQVLVIAAAAPDSVLARALVKDAGPALAGRVYCAAVNPDMGYADRTALARHLLPDLPPAAAERIARRTRTLTEVYTVTIGGGQLTELSADADAGTVLQVVDTAVAARLDQVAPFPEAVVLAWAGGALHTTQARRALEVLGTTAHDDDPRVARTGALVRLAGPPDIRTTEAAAGLATGRRHQLATAVLDAAAQIAADPDSGPVERLVACQAAHHTRGDLTDRTGLAQVQVTLIRSLEQLADPATAAQITKTALAELLSGDSAGRRDLLAAALRLAHTAPGHRDDPAVEEAITLALAGGASLRLEARVWAAVDLLTRPGPRRDGLALARAVTADLAGPSATSAVVAQWRMLLAFHVGKSGDQALAQQLLAPLITAGTADQQQAADAILHATTGPQADIRLQIIFLQAELERTPDDAEQDLLRLHTALARAHHALGAYPQALYHVLRELPLRQQIQGPRHPATLVTRGHIANWTGYAQTPARALQLYHELLPDVEAVQGPRHSQTLSIRYNIAYWTARGGDPATARRLAQELLPDEQDVLGPRALGTLTTRDIIARCTGQLGDHETALHLHQELLPDLKEALGSHHPNTLIARGQIANWTGQLGDHETALHLYQELLPDLKEVLGPRYPNTLVTRGHIANWTDKSGDPADALHLYQEFLPELEDVLGPDHPETAEVRRRIADLTLGHHH